MIKSFGKIITSGILAGAILISVIVSVNKTDAAKKPKLSQNNLKMTVGDRCTLTIKNNEKKAVVIWKSSDRSVIDFANKKNRNVNSVNIKAKGVGKANITVTYKLKKKFVLKCKVNVALRKRDVIYSQKNEVIRWYDSATAAQSVNGHSHTGYKDSNLYVWRIGDFDNEFSTNEKKYDQNDNVLVKKPAYYNSETSINQYNGTQLHITGEIMYEGEPVQNIQLRVLANSPVECPVLYSWQKEVTVNRTESADLLGVAGSNVTEIFAPNTWTKIDLSFKLSKDIKHNTQNEGDFDYSGIDLFIANNPTGQNEYNSGNTFHFRNFTITTERYYKDNGK